MAINWTMWHQRIWEQQQFAPSAVNDAAGGDWPRDGMGLIDPFAAGEEHRKRWAAYHASRQAEMPAEPPAEGATAPKPDPTAPAPPVGYRWVAKGNDFVAKPIHEAPGLGHALHQVNRPVTLCAQAARYMGGRE